jgi:hypothetical protein
MNGPAEDARRFLLGCLLGAGLGLVYGFLRPPRKKHPHLSDLCFSVAAVWAWLQLSFGVCDGDLRLWYTAGLGLGAVAWEVTFGRLLRPVFSLFWEILGKALGFFVLPLKFILKKSGKFLKFPFASVKKWVTISYHNRQHRKHPRGGKYHGKKTQFLQAFSPGVQAKPAGTEDRPAGGHRIVYSDPAGPAFHDPADPR